MIETRDISRPPKEWVAALKEVGAATAASTLAHMGVRSPFMVGPVARNAGAVVAGPALTLQFMPKREDLFSEDEYADPEKQIHRHVLYHTQPGDIVVVDARGDLRSGVFGDMMLTYFKGKGGAGVVIDGCIRDYPNVKRLEPRPVAQRRDAELSRPDRHRAVCRERADRLRRRVRDARRHHRGGRRRRGRGAGEARAEGHRRGNQASRVGGILARTAVRGRRSPPLLSASP